LKYCQLKPKYDCLPRQNLKHYHVSIRISVSQNEGIVQAFSVLPNDPFLPKKTS